MTQYTLATFVPVLALFLVVQRFFASSNRELKRKLREAEAGHESERKQLHAALQAASAEQRLNAELGRGFIPEGDQPQR